MKNILITQRQDYYAERNEFRDSLDIRWYQLMAELNIFPILVPNIFSDYNRLNSWMKTIKPDGLILSGGNDLGESGARDQTETLLLEYAKNINLPVFGVCRGLQMMVHFGKGNLIKIGGHVATRHGLYYNNVKIREVNSFHQFAIKTLPLGYICLGKAKDGSIEHIEHKMLSWHGIMWHPERDAELADQDRQLISNHLERSL